MTLRLESLGDELIVDSNDGEYLMLTITEDFGETAEITLFIEDIETLAAFINKLLDDRKDKK